MKFLVTGAGGFIGSHIVRALLKEKHTVRVIDNFSTGYRWRLDEVRDSIELIEGDICNVDTVRRAVEGVDRICHQAAIPSVARSTADPIASDMANVHGTITLLQCAREAGVQRLVYASSSSAYGNTPELPKHEKMTPNPLSPYAVSKLAAEQYCKSFAGLGFVETVCLRYFNVFGPMQDPTSSYAAVIPKFCLDILNGRPLALNGDGSVTRDFTYIENVVQANLLALTKPGVSGTVANIGCGERHDLNQLIQFIGEALGIEPQIEYNPPRPGDVQDSLADITVARTVLGYDPKVSFKEGLRRTAEWYREHGAEVVQKSTRN